MYIFFKHLIISSILAISLYANSDSTDIINFVTHKFIKNPMVKVSEIKVLDKISLREPKGWEVYFLNIHLTIHKDKNIKELTIPQIIFTDGNFISPSLINMKTGKALEQTMHISLKDSVYDDKHLLVGNKNAKNKIVLFSDPQCFYCKKLIPEIVKAARENPTKLAVYFYHFPLVTIHPVSDIIAKIMILEHKAGNVDNIMKLYSLEIDAKETNVDKVLEKIKKDLKLRYEKKNFLTKKIEEELKHDTQVSIDSMISSTPTVYINGKVDSTRVKYKEYIK